MNNNYSRKSSELAHEIDKRIYDRNIPSAPLQPYLNVRPVMTKYSLLPIVDPRAPIKFPMNIQPPYNNGKVFNPGNTVSPWSGFATDINVESELRNQVNALQKCSQATYVPSSMSNLYHNIIPIDIKSVQPYPNLFVNPQFNPFNPNLENISTQTFNTSTRNELRDKHLKK